MKKHLYFSAALLAASMIVSCADESTETVPAVPADGQRGIALYFETGARTAGTRTFGAGTTESWEKAVNTATVFVFGPDGNIRFRRDLSAKEIADAPTTPVSLIVPDVREGETCDFVVVANRTVPKTVVSVDRLLAELDENAAAYNGTFADVTSKSVRPEGFVMSGRTQRRITKGTTNVGIELARTVAKIEVFLTTTDAFRTKYGDETITIDRITLTRGAQASYLMDRSATNYADGGQNFTTAQESSASRNLFYLFEKAGAVEGSRVLLTVDATYDIDGSSSTTDDRVPVVYEVELTGTGDGRILRNGAYFVNASINGLTGSDILVKIDVADWETLATQHVDVGR